MNILITLCARGGSKGIPGKNIKPLNGKPLIAYSIRVAQRFAEVYPSDITLSTDDADIKRVAEEWGLQTNYVRPAHLATDTAGKIDTIADVVKYEEESRGKQYDYVLDLDVTSPLRTLEDLEQSFKLIDGDDDAYNLFSVNPANKNPYFNMVEPQANGYFNLVKRAADGSVMTRQSAPPVYDMNASFYFYKHIFFQSGLRSAITDRSLIYVMPHICFDLDHPIDFEFISFLLEQQKLDFNISL